MELAELLQLQALQGAGLADGVASCAAEGQPAGISTGVWGPKLTYFLSYRIASAFGVSVLSGAPCT